MLGGNALANGLRAKLIAARDLDRSDAVVIGAGATGGFAAMLLTQAGVRVLVLAAGSARSPMLSRFRRLNRSIVERVLGPSIGGAYARKRQPIQSRCYAWRLDPDAFVDDIDCPYTTPPNQPFVWLRARQLG